MLVSLAYGASGRLDLDLPPERLVGRFGGPTAALPDPVAAVRAALESPRDYPALRRALTPDDRVAVVVDERLSHLAPILSAVLEHVTGAGVVPENVTLLCAERRPHRPWLAEVRAAFPGLALEEHDPADRRKLSYLAATADGRAVYLNRTLVDADQAVVLTTRRYDAVLGHAGGEGDLFPGLTDEATQQELAKATHPDAPTDEAWPALAEAREVAWLAGAPFFVQFIPAAGDGIAAVVAGPAAACAEGQRLLEGAWRARVSRRADTVVAGISGTTAHGFADLTAALACAARVVRPGGRIVALTELNPDPATGTDLLRKAADPAAALQALEKASAAGTAAALQWARVVQHARVSLLSGWDDQTAEDLFVGALRDAQQARSLAASGGDVLVLEDAHRLLADVE